MRRRLAQRQRLACVGDDIRRWQLFACCRGSQQSISPPRPRDHGDVEFIKKARSMQLSRRCRGSAARRHSIDDGATNFRPQATGAT
jgi:hypothetical protein